MKNWAHRLSQSNSRRSAARTELLPLSKPIRDVLSLEYHLQLEALRVGVGSLMALQILTRVAMAAGMLQEFGYGRPDIHSFDEYEQAALGAFSSGVEGTFKLDAAAFRLFAGLVTTHDAQLAVVPVNVVDVIARRLEHTSGVCRA